MTLSRTWGRGITGFMAAAGIAASAHGQCSFSISSMPDFDQKRLGSPPAGLPGDGGMYCVPTSVVNILAYFANRGIPQPATLDGPHYWPAQAHYARVTTTLRTMGILMNTSATGGTGGGDAKTGAIIYGALFAPGRYNVTTYYCPGSCPTPFKIRLFNALGAYSAVCYGRYNSDGFGAFTRTGGHCITANGIANGCSAVPTFMFRDPADDGANTTQSPFVTRSVNLTAQVFAFRNSASQAYVFQPRFRMLGYNTPSFIDFMITLWPTHALTTSNVEGVFQLLRPFPLQGTGLPPVQIFNVPVGSGPTLGLVMHPEMHKYFYVLGRGPTGGTTRLMCLDPATGQSVELLTANDLTKVATNRFGELYALDGRILRLFNVDTTPPTEIVSLTLPGVPQAMAYNDMTDEMALIIPSVGGPRVLYCYDRMLGANTRTAPFPAAVNPAGALGLGFHPDDGTIMVCGAGTPSIFHLMHENNMLTLLRTVALPAGSNPTSPNVNDDGHLLFVSGGMLHEYEQEPASGRFIPSPGSIYAGQPSGPFFALSRSRTNHDPALHEGPTFNNILDPEIGPGVIDCYANCDNSTTTPVLNVLDFACFLNLYASGNIEANCDGSTTPPVLNVNDFACFLNSFAAGCP